MRKSSIPPKRTERRTKADTKFQSPLPLLLLLFLFRGLLHLLSPPPLPRSPPLRQSRFMEVTLLITRTAMCTRMSFKLRRRILLIMTLDPRKGRWIKNSLLSFRQTLCANACTTDVPWIAYDLTHVFNPQSSTFRLLFLKRIRIRACSFATCSCFARFCICNSFCHHLHICTQSRWITRVYYANRLLTFCLLADTSHKRKVDRMLTESWRKIDKKLTERWKKIDRKLTESWQKDDRKLEENWQDVDAAVDHGLIFSHPI